MQFLASHLAVVYIAGGLVGLFIGGECLVRGAVALAVRLGMPKLLIGLTVVGIGTSMPELLVSLQSSLAGAPDLAVGNVVGSNTANLLLILAAGALVTPQVTRTAGVRRDALVMCAAAAGLFWLAWRGQGISRLDGMIMVASLTVYLAIVYLLDRRKPVNTEDLPKGGHPVLAIGLCLFGLVALVAGAHYLIDGATSVARQFGVTEAVIGLTLVAIGTSLPELTVALIAAVRGESEVSLGNVLGSNIFNVMGMLGISALVKPLVVAPEFLRLDLPVMCAASLAVLLPVLFGVKIGRRQAALMLAAYAGYMAWLLLATTA